MTVSLYSPEECEKIALQASLRYVKKTAGGISRKKAGKGFSYFYQDGTRVTDTKTLKRIKSLAIPPAYHDVWVCPFANGHIQATGRDDKNRKQYRYHPLWMQVRQQQKFTTMIEFGRSLPIIRAHINSELDKPVTPDKTQIICAIIYLLDNCCIRIGSSVYAKENQSYGLTTLRKKHLSLEKNKAFLDFTGKNAKLWHVILKDKKIIRVLKKCEEIPGYELFKYKDENNTLNVITSQEINAYLQALTDHPFTAKDFRTWAACRETLCRFMDTELIEDFSTERFKTTLAEVAALLGHTPAICQKSYICPQIIEWWREKRFREWSIKQKEHLNQLSEDERLLFWLEANVI